jgi:hypothetical protein
LALAGVCWDVVARFEVCGRVDESVTITVGDDLARFMGAEAVRCVAGSFAACHSAGTPLGGRGKTHWLVGYGRETLFRELPLCWVNNSGVGNLDESSGS